MTEEIKFCTKCGLNLHNKVLGHFCNIDRFCEDCGEKLPNLISSNYSHKCQIKNNDFEETAKLKARIEKLREALKFYADPLHVDCEDDITDGGEMPSYPKERIWHSGRRAREALDEDLREDGK